MGSALLSFDNRLSDPRPARLVLFQGGLFTFQADSTDTAGQFALVEIEGCPGGEPPLHVHHNEDELFYMLEGELRVRRGDQELTLGPGESAFLPRGVRHTFKIPSRSARWLNYITPGGFESYFRELGHAISNRGEEDSPKPPAPLAEMMRVAGRYGITFLP
jgi:quercetin dioxygenase-like cupin family protein